MSTKAIRRAVAIMGTQARLANAIGVKQGQVSSWYTGKYRVPTKYLAAIESATGGLVTRSDLRPELAAIFTSESAA